MGKLDMNRVLLETALDRALQKLPQDPERTVRNLVDLGERFCRHPNQQRLIRQLSQMLEDGDSAYFEMLGRAVQRVDRDWLRTVLVNIGYDACTVGPKRIREVEAASGFVVPWCLCACVGDGGSVELLRKLVVQGRCLGTHIFLIYDQGADPTDLAQVLRENPRCTFFVISQPEYTLRWDLEELAQCRNLVLFIDLDADGAPEAEELLCRERYLFGFYRWYDDATAGWVTGDEAVQSFQDHATALFLLLPKPGTSQEAQASVYEQIWMLRKRQRDPVILVEPGRDIGTVDQIISQGHCLLAFDQKGRALTAKAEPTDWTLEESSLEEILCKLAPAAEG